MKWLDNYDIGAIIGCTVCIFFKPTWITPIIWVIILVAINNIIYMISKKRKGDN